MSKTILNRLNKILIDRLYGTQHGRHNVDAGNKINDTFDYEAEHCLTNAQVAAELNRVYYENNNKLWQLDYSLYDGTASLVSSIVTEMIFPDGYFASSGGDWERFAYNCKNLKSVTIGQCPPSTAQDWSIYRMFSGCSALETIDMSGIKNTTAKYSYNWGYLVCSSAFEGCRALKTLKVAENFINGYVENQPLGINLDLRDSPLLSLESAKDLLDKLATRTAATAATVTFNTAVYNKLKEAYPDYIENYQATKFWNIAEAEAN